MVPITALLPRPTSPVTNLIAGHTCEYYDVVGKLLFLGSKEFGLELFKQLVNISGYSWEVWHPDDQFDGRSNLADWIDFTSQRAIPFHIIGSKKKFSSSLPDNDFELVIVCGWYWIIEPTDLEKVRLGFWGIHNSLLPKYRGGSPLIWSMLSDDLEVGSSFFKFSTGVDSGAIAYQTKIAKNNKTIQEVLSYFQNQFKAELPRLVNVILRGELVGIDQIDSEATYCKQRHPVDSEIDFTWPATFIMKFVRILQPPYPRAFFISHEKKIEVTQIEVRDSESHLKPGEVIHMNRNEIAINGAEGKSFLVKYI